GSSRRHRPEQRTLAKPPRRADASTQAGSRTTRARERDGRHSRSTRSGHLLYGGREVLGPELRPTTPCLCFGSYEQVPQKVGPLANRVEQVRYHSAEFSRLVEPLLLEVRVCKLIAKGR